MFQVWWWLLTYPSLQRSPQVQSAFSPNFRLQKDTGLSLVPV